MALFRNLGVKLRVSLCDVLSYVSAQTLVFLDLAKNYSFLNWRPAVPTATLMDGHYLVPYFLVFCHKKQENYAAILMSCSLDAAKKAFNMFVNFTPLSVN